MTAGAALASGPAHEAPGPTMGLPSSWCCVCFLARHPFATDYFDCGRFQKPPEGEAKVDEGEREEVACESAASEVTPPGRGQRWREDVTEEARPRFRWLEEVGWGDLGEAGTVGRSQAAEEGRDGREEGVGGPEGELRAGAGGRLVPWSSRPLSRLGTQGTLKEGPGPVSLVDKR